MPSWQQAVALTRRQHDRRVECRGAGDAGCRGGSAVRHADILRRDVGPRPGAPCRETPDVTAQADEFTGSVTIFGKSLGYGTR